MAILDVGIEYPIPPVPYLTAPFLRAEASFTNTADAPFALHPDFIAHHMHPLPDGLASYTYHAPACRTVGSLVRWATTEELGAAQKAAVNHAGLPNHNTAGIMEIRRSGRRLRVLDLIGFEPLHGTERSIGRQAFVASGLWRFVYNSGKGLRLLGR